MPDIFAQIETLPRVADRGLMLVSALQVFPPPAPH
jgi:hypothetical protein